MTARAPNMTEKLAATLVAWQRALGAPFPREHVQLMTADQICSLFEFDHYPVRRVDGGTNHPDNLEPRFIAEHAEKTAKFDVPQIRKADRIVKAEAARRAARDPVIAAIFDEVKGVYDDVMSFRREKPKGRLRSRGFDKTKTRTFAGKVVPRKQKRARG